MWRLSRLFVEMRVPRLVGYSGEGEHRFRSEGEQQSERSDAGMVMVTYSMFEWWNHWPVAQVRSSGISAVAPDRPSHSSLSHIIWDPYTKTDNTMTKILLHGLTTKSAAQLVPLAKSWLSAPSIEVSGVGFQSQGYDQTQRAFVVTRQTATSAPQLRILLQASSESPLINPAFVIRNWGDADRKFRIDRKLVARGADFRYGFVPTLEGRDLVVWLKLDSERPTSLGFAATKWHEVF